MVTVATDGSCRGNPGPGGWGWVTTDGRSGAGGELSTTNNRMELQAVLEALNSLEGALVIQTDSEYVRGIFTGWLANWKAKDRVHKQKNADLVLDIDAKLQGREVAFEWVRGHSGHQLNEQADLLATAAADAISPELSTERATNSRTNPTTRRKKGFPAKFPGSCGNCGARFPIGEMIVRNATGQYVHAQGCPVK